MARWLVVLGMAVWGANRAGAAVADNLPIDLRPALAIGSRSVSYYILEKYYGRFRLSVAGEKKRAPSPAETKAWLEHFLSQQLVIAEAESQGYTDNPEVKRTVRRMERHMLVESNGALWKKFGLPAAHTEDEWKRMVADSAKSIEGLLIRFEDEAGMAAAVGKDFMAAPAEEQMRRVREYQRQKHVAVIEGRLKWPYEPVSEIFSVLAEAETGRWTRYDDPKCGIYVFFIRGIEVQPAAGVEGADQRRMLSAIETQVAHKRFRIEQLMRGKVSVDTATAERVMQLFRVPPESGGELPAITDAALAAATFFRFSDGPRRMEVSVEEYRHWYNDKILRRWPSNEASLRESMDDYVFEELALELVRAAGLDEEPRFAEDRRGFAALQVLDRYEQEVLIPRLGIGPADFERYYQDHLAEYQQTTAIGGRLLTFGTMKDAVDWIRNRRGGGAAANSTPQVAATTERAVVVSLGQPLDGWQALQSAMMQGPGGNAYGPVQHGQGFEVLVKERNVTTGAIPFAAAKENIRYKVALGPLSRREDELAAEVAPRYKIEDHIDYARFGLSRAEVKVPWGQASGK